jgi:hypothetical protein
MWRKFHNAQKMRGVKYPCSVCLEECDGFSIECTDCRDWSHGQCIGLKPSQKVLLERPSMKFYCPRCVKTNGEYDWSKSLNRLVKCL